jgi:hypothetical protein
MAVAALPISHVALVFAGVSLWYIHRADRSVQHVNLVGLPPNADSPATGPLAPRQAARVCSGSASSPLAGTANASRRGCWCSRLRD